MAAGSDTDLRRHRAVSRTIAYAIFVSIALVAAYDLSPWPDWFLLALVGLAIAGLPLTFLLIRASARRRAAQESPVRTGAPSEEKSGAALPAPPLKLAVLPFSDASDDTENARFADGFSADLLALLAQSGRIPVATLISCFSVRGHQPDLRAVGEKLQASHVVTGSIGRQEDVFAIEARLNETGKGETLWSEKFEGTVRDLFTVQEQIVEHVGATLGIDVHPDARVTASTTNPEAYEVYLTGRGYYLKGTLADLAHAVILLSQATETDSLFVRAWVDLAETYALQAIYYEGSDAERKAAHEASEKALELAPDRGDAHAARGIAHLASEEYEEAAWECDRAIELDPTLWEAYYNHARASHHQGQTEQALGLFEKAATINPFDYQSPLLAAPLYKRIGENEKWENAAREGVSRAERFLEDHPENHRAYYLGAGALLDLGERERAVQWAEKALAIDPSDPSIRYNMGCFYAKAGEIDKAFEYLRDSITSKTWIENDPDLDPIREDPRYRQLLESLQ